MTAHSAQPDSILDGIHVLDGGLASELEYFGARIDGPLWSAHVLEDEPEKVTAVYRAYIEAGAECIATCSYQVSRMGYAEFGLPPERADAALLKSVALARATVAEFPHRRVVIAASLGPYGAALHNGAEYHGNYACSYEELVEFHRQRIRVLAKPYRESAALKGTGFSPYIDAAKPARALAPEGSSSASGPNAPDLLAFETLPSLEEAQAIGEALAPWPELPAWFSFTCRDAHHVAHGEPLSACAAAVAQFPQTAAIGVNCIHPSLVPAMIAELRAASGKPILVYPNSGEGWDAAARCWTGKSDPAEYGAMAAEWFAAGAQIVGGCCRTRPAHIRQVAQAVTGAAL
ncbi:MAG: homocysteine S-methyltransferase [Acidobacteriota bacterium]|nr:homocysteine S-methyltransferase [Acidobacteriota bacterium]